MSDQLNTHRLASLYEAFSSEAVLHLAALGLQQVCCIFTGAGKTGHFMPFVDRRKVSSRLRFAAYGPAILECDFTGETNIRTISGKHSVSIPAVSSFAQADRSVFHGDEDMPAIFRHPCAASIRFCRKPRVILLLTQRRVSDAGWIVAKLGLRRVCKNHCSLQITQLVHAAVASRIRAFHTDQPFYFLSTR